MAVQPFFAARDPSIAQSIYNLGHAYLGPDARRRDAQDALEARIGQAKIENLAADTGRIGEVARGTALTNDTRIRLGELGRLYQLNPTPENLANLQGAIGALNDNPATFADAFRNFASMGRFNQGDTRGSVMLVNPAAAGNPSFAANDAAAAALRAEEQAGKVALNTADNSTRQTIAGLEDATRRWIAQRTPVSAAEGNTVLFAPGDPRIPAVAPAERPAPALQPGPAAGVVPTLPPAVPPPNAPAAGSLGNAFVAPQPTPTGPVVRGNAVTVPSAQGSGRQPDPLAEEAKRVALFKSRTDAWSDVSAALQARLDALGAELNPDAARGIIDTAVREAEAVGYQTDANTALNAAFAKLGLAPLTQDGWFYDSTVIGRNGAELDDAGVQQLIQDTLPKVSADAAGKAMFDRLPSGTRFLDPNGQVRIKP